MDVHCTVPFLGKVLGRYSRDVPSWISKIPLIAKIFKMLKIPVAPVILVTNVTCSTNETDIESIRILPQSFRACFEIVKAGPFFKPFSDVEPNNHFQKGIDSR